MADGKAFTISTITRGMCLEVRSNGLFTGKYDSSGGTQSQLWTIERNKDKTAVALRSVSNGQYLRAAVRGDNAKVQTGAKSWWTLERGDAPGAWWLKNNDHGNYLTNYYGHQTANNKVIMWSSNLQGWNYTMQWYINDLDSSGTFPDAEKGGSDESSALKEELEAREKAFREREEKLEKEEQDAVEREKACAERESNVESRESAIAKREAVTKQLVQEIGSREHALAERTQKLEERECSAAGEENSEGTGSGDAQVEDLQRRLRDAQIELQHAKAAQKELAEELEQNNADLEKVTSGKQTVNAADDAKTSILQKRVTELEAQLHKFKISSDTSSVDSQRNHSSLRPISFPQKFVSLPRLVDSRVRDPLLTNLPPRSLPPPRMPRTDLPPKAMSVR